MERHFQNLTINFQLNFTQFLLIGGSFFIASGDNFF